MGQSSSKSSLVTKKSKKKDGGDGSGKSRRVVKQLKTVEEEDGLGVKVKRTIGSDELDYLDPFLVLDEYQILKPSGFTDHPNRGFEIVTYLIQGCMEHEDFLGNKGIIEQGDVQWLSAGRGIVRSNMPAGEDTCHGVRLWINLGWGEKMLEPSYQDIKKEDIPFVEEGGARVKVIAGECMNKKSSVTTRTPTIYLDVQLDKNASFSQPIPRGWNALVYVISGKASFGPRRHQKEGTGQHALVFGKGDRIEAANKEAETCHFLLIAGKPIQEPVMREGNFVMRSMDEIDEAVKDHRFGRNGFENAPSWSSAAGLNYLDSQF